MFGSVIMSSCTKNNDAQIYTEQYSVIKKSDTKGMYFSSDDGMSFYPASFNPQWGEVDDRVLVGFYYNPYKVTENTTSMDITVEYLSIVPTSDSALSSTADTIDFEAFFHATNSNEDGIYAWAAQNYLTVLFFVRYGDPEKHTFGFIEEPELFRHDTLFLSMWHEAKENDKTKTSQSHIALNLSDYEQYLSVRDSTVISIKYKAESANSTSAENYIYNAMYRKKYNQ
jgi:hypothetical protein